MEIISPGLSKYCLDFFLKNVVVCKTNTMVPSSDKHLDSVYHLKREGLNQVPEFL